MKKEKKKVKDPEGAESKGITRDWAEKRRIRVDKEKQL